MRGEMGSREPAKEAVDVGECGEEMSLCGRIMRVGDGGGGEGK